MILKKLTIIKVKSQKKRQVVVLSVFFKFRFSFPFKLQHLGVYTKAYVLGLEYLLDTVS